MGVFKAYDIRGIVPDELDEALAYRVGYAVASFLGGGEIVVGRDARAHSDGLARALRAGIAAGGMRIADLGLVTTPMVYFAVDHLGAAGGIMITASHNPGQYNGFKICREHAIPIGEASGLKDIERMAGQAEDAAGSWSEDVPTAEVREVRLVGEYLDHLQVVGCSLPSRPIKLAIDCGNGMAGVPLEPLLAEWESSGQVTSERLYFEARRHGSPTTRPIR